MPNPYGSFRDISISVEKADFGEQQNLTGEDQEAHVAGKTCKRCGQAIQADQPARLRGVDDWVHDTCPS
jgi:hypothetical protein